MEKGWRHSWSAVIDWMTRRPSCLKLRELATELARSMRVGTARLTLMIEAEEVSLNIETAIPCGLILQELVSNSIKHAFPGGREGELYLALRQDSDGNVTVVVRDTGVGFPEALDFRNTTSLGLQLVSLLTDQLHGTMQLERCQGTTFTLTFTELPAKVRG